MRRRLNELHLLLPLNRQDSGLPARRDATPHMPSLLCGLPVLGAELVACWTHWRALLPHHRCVHDLSSGSNRLHDNIHDWSSVLCHVPSGDGIFLRLSAHSAVGFSDYRSTESQEGCGARAGHCCIERDQHCDCLSLSCVECTVSIGISREGSKY
jgi:hypothetical protein